MYTHTPTHTHTSTNSQQLSHKLFTALNHNPNQPGVSSTFFVGLLARAGLTRGDKRLSHLFEYLQKQNALDKEVLYFDDYYPYLCLSLCLLPCPPSLSPICLNTSKSNTLSTAKYFSIVSLSSSLCPSRSASTSRSVCLSRACLCLCLSHWVYFGYNDESLHTRTHTQTHTYTHPIYTYLCRCT